MIIFITRSNLDDHFHLAVPGLTRALEETSLGNTWSIQGLYDHIVNFAMYAFVQPETGYAGAFMVSEQPMSKSIYCFWSGQDPKNTLPVDHVDAERFLEAAARYFNCSSITVEGRKGWERIGAPLGYREDSRVYIKEVSHELPEIQPVASDGREPDDGRQGQLAL